MKKVVLIGEDESNSFLLQRLLDEGCEVRLITRRALPGVSTLPRALTPEEAREWDPDYVLCDSPGFGTYLKRFRDRGALVLGGGPMTDKFDSDVATALAYLDAANVPTCEYQRFSDVASAVDYVIHSTKPWRLITGNRESVGFPNGMDLCSHLEEENDKGTLPDQFILHRDFPGILDGELSLWSNFHVTGFVHEKGLMNPCFAVSIAHRSEGIPTKEGVTMFPLPTSHPIIRLTLERLALGLGKINYCGPVTLGCLIRPGADHDGWEDWENWDDRIAVHDMSLTPPPGFWAAFLAGLEMPLHFFLGRLLTPARGNNPFDFWEGVVSSRKLTLPPYPTTEAPWLTPEQKAELTKYMPSVPMPYKPNVLWNGLRVEGGAVVQAPQPVLGYLTGKARSTEQSLATIQDEFDFLGIPYAQVYNGLKVSFDVDMLPLRLAERQLAWEQRQADEEDSEKAEPQRVRVAYAG